MTRVRLISATADLLTAAIDSHRRLADELGVSVPAQWPEFPEALAHVLDTVRQRPSEIVWWMYFFVDDARGALVGSGGFAGPPSDGEVEIGYEIAPAFRRRGYASAAVGELLREAVAGGVSRVRACVLTGDERSEGVLRGTGFQPGDRIRVDDQDVTVWVKLLHTAVTP